MKTAKFLLWSASVVLGSFLANPLQELNVDAAELIVEGDVITVNELGVRRLWCKGRPGVIRFAQSSGDLCIGNDFIEYGLSNILVDWDSAADGCPAGTWVCSIAEIFNYPCETVRPDTDRDRIQCDGSPIDHASDMHVGWLANANSNGNVYSKSEFGSYGYGEYECVKSPVWCCSEPVPH